MSAQKPQQTSNHQNNNLYGKAFNGIFPPAQPEKKTIIDHHTDRSYSTNIGNQNAYNYISAKNERYKMETSVPRLHTDRIEKKLPSLMSPPYKFTKNAQNKQHKETENAYDFFTQQLNIEEYHPLYANNQKETHKKMGIVTDLQDCLINRRLVSIGEDLNNKKASFTMKTPENRYSDTRVSLVPSQTKNEQNISRSTRPSEYEFRVSNLRIDSIADFKSTQKQLVSSKSASSLVNNSYHIHTSTFNYLNPVFLATPKIDSVNYEKKKTHRSRLSDFVAVSSAPLYPKDLPRIYKK